MDTMINTATTTFLTTTGFDLSAAVTWAATNLYKLWIGSGLGLLYNLRVWIMAVVLIYATIYFVYRLWIFFRH